LPKELPEKQRKDVEKLSKLSGEEFDKAYMKTMVRDHKKDVKDFEKASKDLADADLKGWAAKTLPTLEEHLKLAEQTAGQTKQEGKEGGETTGSVKRM
jgi:putative membrane protein